MCLHGVTSPSSRCFTACSYSTYHYELALHPGKCAPVLDILCQREIPEGKFEQAHLQDVQISAETKNLAGLSEMLIAVSVGFVGFFFFFFCYISCLLLIQLGHHFLFHDISTLRICWECKHIPAFICSFFGREVTNICFLVSWPGRHSLCGEVFSAMTQLGAAPCWLQDEPHSWPGAPQGEELLWDQWQSQGLQMEKSGGACWQSGGGKGMSQPTRHPGCWKGWQWLHGPRCSVSCRNYCNWLGN